MAASAQQTASLTDAAGQLTLAAALQKVADELGFEHNLAPRQLVTAACHELHLQPTGSLRSMASQICSTLEIPTGWSSEKPGAMQLSAQRTSLVVVGGWDSNYRRTKSVNMVDLTQLRDSLSRPPRGADHSSGWTALPNLRTPRAGAAVSTTQRKTIVAAGGDSVAEGHSVEALCIGATEWRDLPPLQVGRTGAVSCLLHNGFLAVIGGVGKDGILDSVEVLPIEDALQVTCPADLKQHTVDISDDNFTSVLPQSKSASSGWHSRAAMKTARANCGLVGLPSSSASQSAKLVVVVGGEVVDIYRGISQTAEIYDVESDSWSMIERRLSVERFGCGAASLVATDSLGSKGSNAAMDTHTSTGSLLVFGGYGGRRQQSRPVGHGPFSMLLPDRVNTLPPPPPPSPCASGRVAKQLDYESFVSEDLTAGLIQPQVFGMPNNAAATAGCACCDWFASANVPGRGRALHSSEVFNDTTQADDTGSHAISQLITARHSFGTTVVHFPRSEPDCAGLSTTGAKSLAIVVGGVDSRCGALLSLLRFHCFATCGTSSREPRGRLRLRRIVGSGVPQLAAVLFGFALSTVKLWGRDYLSKKTNMSKLYDGL